MKRTEMNRRDFTRLTAAAFGGVVAGSLAGCGETATDTPATAGGAAEPTGDGDAMHAEGSGTSDGGEATYDVANLLEEKHVCRGLNTCMGKGASGDNACGGQGACATAEAHSCHAENACKGEGGCGDFAGQNSCKGTGECSVPLNEGTWTKARAAFEKAMADAGKDVGAAPDAG